MNKRISEADLIINSDGTVYHLNLLPGDISDLIITVGDPERVTEVSKHFDKIDLIKGKREFITHTGYIGSRRISVVSTGIGTDNIDIVLNELDALVNIDFGIRQIKQNHQTLKIIRIGTSGSIQPDIEMGSILASSHGIGMDSLMHYYHYENTDQEKNILEQLTLHTSGIPGVQPYIFSASDRLIATLASKIESGITLTAPGFYAPQGRSVRAPGKTSNLIELFSSFYANSLRITNLEMETAGIYALSRVLGHEALSINAILASRVENRFADNPEKIVTKAIKSILDQVESL